MKYRLILFLFFFQIIAVGQSQQISNLEIQEETKAHRISVTTGYTFVYSTVPDDSDIFNKGRVIPTVGLNYMYRMGKRFSIASLNELELSSYTIVEKDDRQIEREFVYISVLAGVFKVRPRWYVAAGAGIELEKHQNFYVLRIGTEYEVPIRKDWDVSFALEYDYKEEYSSFAFLISFGKQFGRVK